LCYHFTKKNGISACPQQSILHWKSECFVACYTALQACKKLLCMNSVATEICGRKVTMESSVLPNDWKMGHITAMHKKGNKMKANNYQPICLTTMLLKYSNLL